MGTYLSEFTGAQKRANDMADKNIVRSLVTALNQTTGIDFEGTVEITEV